MAWWNPFEKKDEPAKPEPALEPIPDSERGRLLAQCIAQAEAAYDQMYESRSPSGPYNEMKESMHSAIALARELGLPNRVARLEKDLEHRKSVFRSQMS